MSDNDPTGKSTRETSIIEKEDMEILPQMERWRRTRRRTAVRDVELVDFGAKPRCLKFRSKASLDRTPIVTPLMMMIRIIKKISMELDK